jgi:DnaJ-class molecular chaperone
VILIIRAVTTDSEEWVRQGADLTYTVTLSVAEMLLGWQRVLRGHPSGKDMPIAWTGGILREGEIVVLKGLGMPNRNGGKGDLRLVCKTTGNQSGLSEEQRSALKLVWPDWKEVSVDGSSNIPVRHG